MLTLAVGIAVVLFGRGGDDHTAERRDAVSAYIVKVNTTQQTLIVELERVSTAYRKLELKGDPTPAELARVDGVERTLTKLRSRFAALNVPVEARKLHAELLQVVDLQTALAREMAGMVRYLPFQARENRKLVAATPRATTTS